MKNKNPHKFSAIIVLLTLAFGGCTSATRTVSDIGLAGLGGVAGYKLSDGNVGAAGIGAAAGYAASKIAQAGIQTEIQKAQKEGYDRAMNQAVKQQYWIIQNQQKASDTPRYVPIQVPAQKINGILTTPTVHYIKIDP